MLLCSSFRKNRGETRCQSAALQAIAPNAFFAFTPSFPNDGIANFRELCSWR
jgi:hypothetical protein